MVACREKRSRAAVAILLLTSCIRAGTTECSENDAADSTDSTESNADCTGCRCGAAPPIPKAGRRLGSELLAELQQHLADRHAEQLARDPRNPPECYTTFEPPASCTACFADAYDASLRGALPVRWLKGSLMLRTPQPPPTRLLACLPCYFGQFVSACAVTLAALCVCAVGAALAALAGGASAWRAGPTRVRVLSSSRRSLRSSVDEGRSTSTRRAEDSSPPMP